ncbi:MAG: hypothetical protein BM556_17955 [Bacteriovorax sp. MedPE-SWde]|nr:MAG: hypothetical protein BM556_17955 [Bacteriovorax sp. MedPE-SWde]
MKKPIIALAVLAIIAVGYLYTLKNKQDKSPKVSNAIVIKDNLEEEKEVEEEVVVVKNQPLQLGVNVREQNEDKEYEIWLKKLESFIIHELKKEEKVLNQYYKLREDSEKDTQQIEKSYPNMSDEELSEIITDQVDSVYETRIEALLGEEEFQKFKIMRSKFNMQLKKKYPNLIKNPIEILF